MTNTARTIHTSQRRRRRRHTRVAAVRHNNTRSRRNILRSPPPPPQFRSESKRVCAPRAMILCGTNTLTLQLAFRQRRLWAPARCTCTSVQKERIKCEHLWVGVHGVCFIVNTNVWDVTRSVAPADECRAIQCKLFGCVCSSIGIYECSTVYACARSCAIVSAGVPRFLWTICIGVKTMIRFL